MAVAITVGRPGIDTLLVASQVVLSVVLPFVTFPLLYCTSKKSIMSVIKTSPSSSVQTLTYGAQNEPDPFAIQTLDRAERSVSVGVQDERVDYSNGKLSIGLGVLIWLVVVAANMYVIVELGLGNSG